MQETGRLVFRFFTEVGIIHQLSSSLLNKRLPEGLHVSHFSVLGHLASRTEGETPLQLASAFQVTKGTMTHTLSTLSKRGFVRITPHESDGRSKVVFLTDEGRSFQQQALQAIGPSIFALSEKIDWAEVVKILPQLEAVRKVLDENRDI